MSDDAVRQAFRNAWVNERVRQEGVQVAFVAGPYTGRNGRSMGASGAHEIRVFVFGVDEYAYVDVSDVDVFDA